MKKKVWYIVIGVLVIAIIVAITLFLVFRNNENNNNEEELSLNSELNGMVAVAKRMENDISKIVVLKEDGTRVDITQNSATEYEALDYYNGKIYLQRGKDFYSIDLSQGDGNYKLEKVLTFNMEESDLPKDMYVYDGKIYLNKNKSQIIAYDLATGVSNTITEETEYTEFKMDKENGLIYYCEATPEYSLKEYNISTGETKIIDTNDSELVGDNEYYYQINLYDVSQDGKILYSKYEKEGNERPLKYYLYDTNTGEKEEIEGFQSGTISDGKLYYCASMENEPMYPDYNLRVYENGTVKEITEAQENDYMYFFDLGNGKIQAVMTWGQDTSTSGEQAYLIDKETIQIEETRDKYVLVHVIQNADNKVSSSNTNVQDDNVLSNNTSNNTDTNEEETIITSQIAMQIIGKKWGTEVPNTDSAEDGYSIIGGYSNIKVKDLNGLEYYVFPYYAVSSDGLNRSYVQTIFISIDGKKYKISTNSENLKDGEIITDFNEEGDTEVDIEELESYENTDDSENIENLEDIENDVILEENEEI